MFSQNIGTTGRILRFILACLLLALAYWQASWILFAIALFTFYEALIGWCAFNALFGINSCSIKNK